MNRFWAPILVVVFGAGLIADQRTNPPTLQETSPLAIPRGLTTEVKVEGINLRGASAVLFDDPALSGRILHVNTLGEFVGTFIGSNGTRSTIERGAPPPLNQVTMEVTAAPETPVGLYRFRVLTQEGTTNTGVLSVDPYYGARPEIEPNDTLQKVFLQDDYIFPPTIITGTLAEPGDVDYLPLQAIGGEELVIQVSAGELGSKLRWSLDLLDERGVRLAGRSVLDERREPVLAYRIPADGEYFLKVSDVEWGGSRDHFYRLKIGIYPYLTSAFPLGVGENESTAVTLRGHNLGDRRRLKVTGRSDYAQIARLDLRPEFEAGAAHNELKLAVGQHTEITEEESRDSPFAMTVQAPVTINGRVSGFTDRGRNPDEDYFRFHAVQGQQYVIEVEARRLGSPLDSVVEVLDLNANPIPRAEVRALVGTRQVLSDRNSASPGLRLESPAGFEVGDYVMIGNEILRVKALPRTPDDDFRFDSLGGQRVGYFNTTPEAHAVDTPAYKVTLHPPGTTFALNGLPVRTLYFRNDDGGPGYGKDSLLEFTAPADGDYLVHLRDLRGQQGEDYAYRLTIREAQPDFRLSVSPSNPNVPRGGGVVLSVNATRLDGFDGPIELEVRGVPEGIRATRETIIPGETGATLVLWADEYAALSQPVLLKVVGRSVIAGEEVTRLASADDRLRYISLAEPADVEVEIESPEVTLEAGGTTKVAVRVTRRKGFEGRVPISVLNLPSGIKVSDVGLNGVLVTEDESRREFTLEALPWVKPTERLIAVTGRVETRSPLRNEYAARPFTLKVTPGKLAQASQAASDSTAGATASAEQQ